PRRRVEERRPAPRDPEAQGAVHVVRLAVRERRLGTAPLGALGLDDVAAQREPPAAERPGRARPVVGDAELPLPRGLLAVEPREPPLRLDVVEERRPRTRRGLEVL